MGKFDRFAFAASPQFDEAATRVAFAKAVPLQTLIIYCYDPRAAEIPNAVAKWLGAEEYPGRVIVDQNGKRVASTTTIFPIVVAGGRAVDALRSIAVAQHLFGVQNIASSSTTPIAVRRHLPRMASSQPTSTSTTSTSPGSTIVAASVLRTTKCHCSAIRRSFERMPAHPDMSTSSACSTTSTPVH
jgi:hypothetical protein